MTGGFTIHEPGAVITVAPVTTVPIITVMIAIANLNLIDGVVFTAVCRKRVNTRTATRSDSLNIILATIREPSAAANILREVKRRIIAITLKIIKEAFFAKRYR